MKLLATMVTALSLFGSGAAFGQAVAPLAFDAPQTAAPRGGQTIKITRSGSQPGSTAESSRSLAELRDTTSFGRVSARLSADHHPLLRTRF